MSDKPKRKQKHDYPEGTFLEAVNNLNLAMLALWDATDIEDVLINFIDRLSCVIQIASRHKTLLDILFYILLLLFIFTLRP